MSPKKKIYILETAGLRDSILHYEQENLTMRSKLQIFRINMENVKEAIKVQTSV